MLAVYIGPIPSTQDFYIVPAHVWTAFEHWYTAYPALPRPVIPAGVDGANLEVYVPVKMPTHFVASELHK
jgi:hypothetical protein